MIEVIRPKCDEKRVLKAKHRGLVCIRCHNKYRKRKNKGWYVNQRGYLEQSIEGKHVLQHRLIMETFLGRSLSSKEHVHHINGDPLDNRIENLEVLDVRTHHREHLGILDRLTEKGLI